MSDEEELWLGGPCPKCGSRTFYGLDCPGWGSPLRVCVPCCGNATTVFCEDCGWWYAEPWRRSRDYLLFISDEPMGERPEWFRGFLEGLEDD